MKIVRFSAPSIDLDRRCLLQARDVLRNWIEQKIDLSGQQCRGARRVRFDRRVNHFGNVALLRLCSPPVRIDDEHRLDIDLARLQHERAGAVGIARSVGFFLLHEVLRRNDFVLLGPPLVDDPQLGQLPQQHRIRHRRVDDHRIVINRVGALNADGVLTEVRRRLHRAIDREHDIGRGQRRAVVKLDALAQVEAPDQRRLLLPVG